MGLVGICRLRRFDVVRRMISDNALFSEAMTQEDMAREHRNPSRHRIEEHDVLNWLKANRKLVNAGKMKAERAELFEKLLEMGEKLRRVNQWG